MATKSNLITALNGFISAVVGITKHRNANNAIVDEIYPNSVFDSQLSETYTNYSNEGIDYSINIIKSGNIAHIKGRIKATSPSSFISSVLIFSWKNNEFKTKSASVSNPNLISQAFDLAGNSVSIGLTSDGLFLVSGIISGLNYFYFHITYITQD